jgi:hypothetical protein
MGAFSIGEEFGIDLEPAKPPPAAMSTPSIAPPSPPPRPKQDALMDALNDLDADLLDDEMHNMTEEINFDHSDAAPISSLPTRESTEAAQVSSPPLAAKEETVPSAEAPKNDVADDVKPMPVAPREENLLGNMEDDLADLNIVDDAGEDLLGGAGGEFDDFDDLEDDDELADLENFLTQVSSK